MKKLLTYIMSITLLATVFAATLTPVSFAATNAEAICVGSGGTWSGTACTSPDGRSVPGTLQQIGDLLIFLIGGISVLVIIIAGIRYVVSAGDQAAITGAKNTILYAIIGILVAVMAYAIVHFVLGALNIH